MSHTTFTRTLFLTALVVLTLTSGLWADDVSGADRLLCASLEATRCSLDGCETKDPVMWNIPQFIEIDLENKRLQTTAASGERRATPITTLVREDGHIFIQGIEGGRAFSFVIHEASGELNAAVAASETATAVFAACTPLNAAE
ncbi:MAG: hypothetical protein DRQ54_11320 [Gammaproteobacteria bacterium]|nr:MAG: hypothetical protein DRQ54_11320 [Gammaproteobacteria bacterium]